MSHSRELDGVPDVDGILKPVRLLVDSVTVTELEVTGESTPEIDGIGVTKNDGAASTLASAQTISTPHGSALKVRPKLSIESVQKLGSMERLRGPRFLRRVYLEQDNNADFPTEDERITFTIVIEETYVIF